MSAVVTTPQLLEALSRTIPEQRLVTDRDVVASLSADDAEWAPVGSALAALRARSEAEVQEAVRICADLRVPVVPRGAGTGLSGGANAVDGCLVLDLSAMNRVLEIDVDNMVAVVEPGVINDDLKAAVAAHGLWYPPDPASAAWSCDASSGSNRSSTRSVACPSSRWQNWSRNRRYASRWSACTPARSRSASTTSAVVETNGPGAEAWKSK